VNKEMAKAENILKVLLSTQETMVDTYKALIKDNSEADFQKLLSLKVK
jgi:6-phosphogluconolactonase/glucosamine-6-phosphate isomerase/deaminase